MKKADKNLLQRNLNTELNKLTDAVSEDMVAEARAELAESKQLPAVEAADNISDNGA